MSEIVGFGDASRGSLTQANCAALFKPRKCRYCLSTMRARLKMPGSKAKRLTLSWLALFTLIGPTSVSAADERPLEIGLGLRFMPTGSFEWTGRPGDHPSNLRAVPALGGSLFVDYRLNPFLSIGFMPELTLNVIPKIDTGYPVSALIAGSLRLKVQCPTWRYVVPYILLAPGYSWLHKYGTTIDSGNSHGFLVGAYGGARVPVTTRHSIFSEVGYLRGFQKSGEQDYAPSYLVVALGWQASL